MKPGHGEVLLAEGDVEVQAEEEQLVAEFRRQLDEREVGFATAYRTYQTLSRRKSARLWKTTLDQVLDPLVRSLPPAGDAHALMR